MECLFNGPYKKYNESDEIRAISVARQLEGKGKDGLEIATILRQDGYSIKNTAQALCAVGFLAKVVYTNPPEIYVCKQHIRELSRLKWSTAN